MIRTTLMALATCAATALATPTIAEEGASPMQTEPAPSKSGYVQANGVDYYCEIRGEGEPLLLLHGGLGTIDMFAPLTPMLAENRQVIAVDLYGQGRTALTDRPMSLLDMGDDMAVILETLGYQQVDALG